MINQTILALFIAFAVTAAICPGGIRFLHKLKFGQEVRDDGPQAHLKKKGTPTMGGVMFLIGITVSGLIFAFKNPEIFPILFLTVGFGVVGFLDDFIKIAKKRSEGLTPKQKLLGQLVITGVFAALCIIDKNIGTAMKIPFLGMSVNLPVFIFVPALFFIVLGTDNGTNFTDGLDGLASSVTVVVALFFACVAIRDGYNIAPVCGAVAGGLMAFLLFNVYPAKVFMGDTGSLALGGFVASAAYVMNMPLYIAIVGLIYMIEVISVIIQVGYFRKTGGKRFFRMAPIHHHFELGGWSETRVVGVFTIVTALLCMLAYMG